MSATQVALFQFRPVKGASQTNLDHLEATFVSLAADPSPPDLLILPEAALTGYFLEGGVRDHARDAAGLFEELNARHARSGARPIEICLGFYERRDGRYYNAALWASLGGDDAGIRHVHHKVFLPTYGVFDEERFVDGGHEVRAFDTRIGRVAMLVCEDIWHSLTPTIAALDGATLLAVVAAGPGRGLAPGAGLPGWPATQAHWEHLVRGVAGEHGIFVALTQLTGFEGGKAFPGGSLLASPTGELLRRGPAFEEALLRETIDLADVARVRAVAPFLGDLQIRLPWLIEALRTAGKHPAPVPLPPPRRTAVPAQRSLPSLAIDPDLTRRWLVAFLRAEFEARGFQHAVIGLSGGLDSAVVAWLAAEAFGTRQVTAIRMPHRKSSEASLDHARLVTDALGIAERTVDISSAADGLVGVLGNDPTPARLGNIMARLRMTTLFDAGAELSALPLGTGNKSERLLGYFTWHGDDAPPVNPLGDLYKSQVFALAEHLGIPDAIRHKAPTADLVAGQTDEGDFGITYARADPILELLLQGFDDAAILAHGVTVDELARVRRRLDGTHWKRKLPTVAMLSGTAIGEFYLRPVDY